VKRVIAELAIENELLRERIHPSWIGGGSPVTQLNRVTLSPTSVCQNKEGLPKMYLPLDEYIAGVLSKEMTDGFFWSGRYLPGSGFQGWRWGQGIVKGKPSVTCGSDSVAYVAARDNWDSLWLARVQGNSWLGWSYGGGIMSADPQVAAAGNRTVYAVIQDIAGGVWYRGYTEGTANGWQGWEFTNGVLQTGSPAAVSGELYVVGRDWNNALWWYRATGSQWTHIGSRGIAAGRLAAAPR
jgi:hypothetical protein